MTVTGTTTDAAVAVLAALIDARPVAGHHFEIAVSHHFGPPITYRITVDLPAEVLRQLRAIPDTKIT